jgi:hypothetical protein
VQTTSATDARVQVALVQTNELPRPSGKPGEKTKSMTALSTFLSLLDRHASGLSDPTWDPSKHNSPAPRVDDLREQIQQIEAQQTDHEPDGQGTSLSSSQLAAKEIDLLSQIGSILINALKLAVQSSAERAHQSHGSNQEHAAQIADLEMEVETLNHSRMELRQRVDEHKRESLRLGRALLQAEVSLAEHERRLELQAVAKRSRAAAAGASNESNWSGSDGGWFSDEESEDDEDWAKSLGRSAARRRSLAYRHKPLPMQSLLTPSRTTSTAAHSRFQLESDDDDENYASHSENQQALGNVLGDVLDFPSTPVIPKTTMSARRLPLADSAEGKSRNSGCATCQPKVQRLHGELHTARKTRDHVLADLRALQMRVDSHDNDWESLQASLTQVTMERDELQQLVASMREAASEAAREARANEEPPHLRDEFVHPALGPGADDVATEFGCVGSLLMDEVVQLAGDGEPGHAAEESTTLRNSILSHEDVLERGETGGCCSLGTVLDSEKPCNLQPTNEGERSVGSMLLAEVEAMQIRHVEVNAMPTTSGTKADSQRSNNVPNGFEEAGHKAHAVADKADVKSLISRYESKTGIANNPQVARVRSNKTAPTSASSEKMVHGDNARSAVVCGFKSPGIASSVRWIRSESIDAPDTSTKSQERGTDTEGTTPAAPESEPSVNSGAQQEQTIATSATLSQADVIMPGAVKASSDTPPSIHDNAETAGVELHIGVESKGPQDSEVDALAGESGRRDGAAAPVASSALSTEGVVDMMPKRPMEDKSTQCELGDSVTNQPLSSLTETQSDIAQSIHSTLAPESADGALSHLVDQVASSLAPTAATLRRIRTEIASAMTMTSTSSNVDDESVDIVMPVNKIAVRGQLLIKSLRVGRRRAWRPRYCVLKGPRLEVFRSELDSRPSLKVPLDGTEVRVVHCNVHDANHAADHRNKAVAHEVSEFLCNLHLPACVF